MVETIYTDDDGYKLKFTDQSQDEILDVQIEIINTERDSMFYNIGDINDLDIIIGQLIEFGKKFKENNK